MFTEGFIYDEKLVDQQVYQHIDVTEETYDQEYIQGLWINNPFKIEYGNKTLVFYYKHPNGLLIDTESVSIVYDGEQGSQFLGIFQTPEEAEESIDNRINEGDYYLNETDGCIYEAHKTSYTTWNWNKVDYDESKPIDTKYTQAVTQAISQLDSNDESTLPIIKALNVWCKKLAAQTALIQNLFSHKITLLEGEDGEKGSIQSDTFKELIKPTFRYQGKNNYGQGVSEWVEDISEILGLYDTIAVEYTLNDKDYYIITCGVSSVGSYFDTVKYYISDIGETSPNVDLFNNITSNIIFSEQDVGKYIWFLYKVPYRDGQFIYSKDEFECIPIKKQKYGFKLDSDGNIDLSNVRSRGGYFEDIEIEGDCIIGQNVVMKGTIDNNVIYASHNKAAGECVLYSTFSSNDIITNSRLTITPTTLKQYTTSIYNDIVSRDLFFNCNICYSFLSNKVICDFTQNGTEIHEVGNIQFVFATYFDASRTVLPLPGNRQYVIAVNFITDKGDTYELAKEGRWEPLAGSYPNFIYDSDFDDALYKSIDNGRITGAVLDEVLTKLSSITSNIKITNGNYIDTYTLMFNNLPIQDPLIQGVVYNDNGTLKISSGTP